MLQISDIKLIIISTDKHLTYCRGTMVYILQLLPTYLLHLTYGLSLGKLKEQQSCQDITLSRISQHTGAPAEE